jgi:hypothetical protein
MSFYYLCGSSEFFTLPSDSLGMAFGGSLFTKGASTESLFFFFLQMIVYYFAGLLLETRGDCPIF